MPPERPSIPDEVARRLRQEAGFGCCNCGHPIITYHHIIPYAQDQHFRPEDMMALCPNCHDAANKGGMSIDEQRRLKSQPYNIRLGYVSGSLTVSGESLQVNMGENLFIGGGTIISADEEPLVSLDLNNSGSLELTLRLYDERHNLTSSIDRNEWVSRDHLPWDIDASYQRLTIRKAKGDISLDLDLRRTPASIRANLWWKGHLILVSPSDIRVDHQLATFKNCSFRMCSLSISTSPKLVVGVVTT